MSHEPRCKRPELRSRLPASFARRTACLIGTICALQGAELAEARETTKTDASAEGDDSSTEDGRAPSRPVDEQPVDIVITGTRTPENAQRSTVSVDVVTRTESERRGATNVAEALQGHLGVQVNPSSYGSIGSPSAIRIQGLDRDRVLILEDGERVIGAVGGAIDLSKIPLTDVERLEVVAGPASALYGTQALGGVVNILTGPPRRRGASGRVRIEGRHPWGALAQGQGFYRRGGVWAGLESSAQYNEGLRLREDVIDLALPERRQYMVGGRVGAMSLGGFDVQLRARWVRDEQNGRTEVDVPGLGSFQTELPDHVDRVLLQARQTYTFGGGSTLRVMLNRQTSSGVTMKDRVDSPVDETRYRYGRLHSAEVVSTIADGDRTWVAGVRGETERFDQNLERVQVLGGQLVTSAISEVAPKTIGHGAVYGQLKWDLFEALTVLAGVRGEAHLGFGGVVAPRLAVAVRPHDKVVVRATAGRGFRVPSARELGFFFDHSALGYRVIGNEDLSPEQSWGFSGNVTLRPSDRGRIRLGVYANFIEDLISVDYLQTSLSGVDDFTYQNVGKARTFGWQVDGRWRASSWLRSEAGYAFSWTRNDTEERPLVGRPPHTAYGTVIATTPFGLEALARFRSVSHAFIDEQTRAPGFTTLDARISQVVHPLISAYAGALNLLDVRKDPFRLGDQRPLSGRTFYLGLTATFSENPS